MRRNWAPQYRILQRVRHVVVCNARSTTSSAVVGSSFLIESIWLEDGSTSRLCRNIHSGSVITVSIEPIMEYGDREVV